MGAEWFTTEATGETALAAFSSAVAQAQYDHGHAGYSGTLAEKDTFVEVHPGEALLDRAAAEALANDYFRRVADAGSPLAHQAKIDDKWGPAGVVEYIGEATPPRGRCFLFFGWASS